MSQLLLQSGGQRIEDRGQKTIHRMVHRTHFGSERRPVTYRRMSFTREIANFFFAKGPAIGEGAVAICHLVWHYELLGLSVYRSVYRVVGFQPHPYNVYSAII